MNKKIFSGRFENGIEYLKMGSGDKTAIFFPGGPGNTLPKGLASLGFVKAMKRFAEEFTMFLICRKPNLSEGYSTSDMADDYAELISNEFRGHVDLIIGFSYGGLILQHFCAKYPNYADAFVIAGSAHKISQKAKDIDYNFAKLIVEKNDRKAMAIRSEAVFQKGMARELLYGFLWIFVKLFLGKITEEQRKDTLIEAKAEMLHDVSKVLENIERPILIVCGEDDFAFPVDDVKEMALKIKNSQLLIYNSNHSSIILFKTFYDDVIKFYKKMIQLR